MPTKRVKATLTEIAEKVIMYILCQYNIYIAPSAARYECAPARRRQETTEKDQIRQARRSEPERVRGDREKVEAATGRVVSFLFLSIKAPKRGVIAVYPYLLILS